MYCEMWVINTIFNNILVAYIFSCYLWKRLNELCPDPGQNKEGSYLFIGLVEDSATESTICCLSTNPENCYSVTLI